MVVEIFSDNQELLINPFMLINFRMLSEIKPIADLAIADTAISLKVFGLTGIHVIKLLIQFL
ncbi:hypothetical protein D9M71_432790 [compost metagenome]